LCCFQTTVTVADPHVWSIPMMVATMARALGLLVLIGVTLAASAAAARQESAPPQEPSRPTFSSESELVVLQVAVFDRSGDAVPELTRDVFQVVEDGRTQTITLFSGENSPVAVGLVVDNSSSMLTRRGMVVAGIKAFAGTNKPDDQAFTVVFNENVHRALPGNAPFTSNPFVLEASVTAVPAGGKTALHDAVIAGLDHLASSDRQKRVLVVLSDGEDNASRQSEDEMLRRAERSDALIYTVSTARLDVSVGNERLLRKLARSTGGSIYVPKAERDVVAAFADIAGKIRQGYTIGYVPTNGKHDGTYRRLIVRVRGPGLRQPVVHVRDGYLAPLHDDGR
jgi:Ca-activated chloride channel homolog